MADRAEVDQADIAITGPPLLPDLPHISYVLRKNPITANEPLVRIAADQIKTPFDGVGSGG